MKTIHKVLPFLFSAVFSCVSLSATSTPPVGFDPTTPESQEYLYNTYATGLPDDLQTELDTLFADPIMRALLSAPLGEPFDTSYFRVH